MNYLILVSMVAGILLYIRQNKPGVMGGPICKAKAFWLYYTIVNWFFILPYALYVTKDIPVSHSNVWLCLTLSMWIRGVAELYMLYVSKNWTPTIGISHDIFTILLMAIGLVYGGVSTFINEPILTFYTASLFLSVCAETHYARSFFKIMRGKTQGEEGLWYAHEHDPRFKRIILTTAIINNILFAALITFYWKYLL
jgi:hypothetical protein